MTEQTRKSTQAPTDDRRIFVHRAAAAIGCLLLASAGICWVAANWQNASSLAKLAGGQLLIVVLVVAAWFAHARHYTPERPYVPRNRNFMASAHLVGLAGVAIGALLALIGQIYQTGADTWQLFIVWGCLLIPWLITQPTIFLSLLFALVLNTSLGLYLDIHEGGVWLGWGSWASSALLAALLNAVLLGLWERFIKLIDDPWRIGPRVLATLVAAWLVAAAFMGIDTGAGPVALSIVGWMGLAVMYLVYTRLRHDLAVVSVAVLAAFVLLVLPLLYWVGSEAGLLLVVLVLLAAMAIGLRKLGMLLRARAVQAEPWYVSAFRLVAMGITAVLLMVFLLLVLDFNIEALWIPGLVLCMAGLLTYRGAPVSALRELGLTLMTAGLLLAGGSFFTLYEEGAAVATYALLALGVGLYAPAGNAAFRFITAFFVLGMATIMTWPLSEWSSAVFGVGHTLADTPLSVYMRMWWFSVLGALALLWGRGNRAGMRWRPLGWALVFLAQIIVWHTPAPPIGLVFELLRHQPSVAMIWLACAALPVVALAAVLARGPALPATLRLGAPLALAVATVGWMGAPGVSLALLWLIMGYAMKHRSLMVFGVLALLAYLMRFYYQLDTTLLHKSFVLGTTGAWLLALAWVFKRGSSGETPQGRVPEAQSDAFEAIAADGRAAIKGSGWRAQAWRRAGLVTGLLLVLVVANTGIYEREKILGEGQRVILELAPVDPRSLMQGDYMRLNFDVANQFYSALSQAPGPTRLNIKARQAGRLVLRPDESGVHRLLAVIPLNGSDIDSDLANEQRPSVRPDVGPGPNPDSDTESGADAWIGAPVGAHDVLLEFRMRRGSVRIVTDSWFFPEGQATHFAQARYGEFRVDANGTGLLVNMLDQQLRPLSQP